MNDNYLWDRTGKPDTEVQELEELLGTLRYQPRQFEIPATIRRSNRMVLPLAIAAAIALLMIGAGLWMRFANSRAESPVQAAHDSQSAPATTQTSPPDNARTISTPVNETTKLPQDIKRNQTVLARNVHRPIRVAAPSLTPQELAEKEQVLVALRLLSAKLNLVQRKSQGLPQVNTIRNQHKMG
jgi:hypothetical protein